MASKSLGTLTLDLIAKIGGFTGPMDKAARNTKKNADDISSSLKGIGKASVALGAGVAVGFGAMVKHSIDVQDELSKTSQKIGISVEDLSALKYTADLAGVGIEELSASLGKFSQGIADAATTGVGAAADALADLGIKTTDTNGKLKSTYDIFTEVSDQLANLQDGALKTSLSMDLFGKSGKELIPLLNGGAKGLREGAEEAKRFGKVYSTEAAKGAEDFNDSLDRLQASITGVADVVAGSVVKDLAELTKTLQDQNTQQSLASLASLMTKFSIQAVKAASALGSFVHFLDSDIDDATDALAEDVGTLEKQLKSLSENAYEIQIGVNFANDEKAQAELEKIYADMNRVADRLAVARNKKLDAEIGDNPFEVGSGSQGRQSQAEKDAAAAKIEANRLANEARKQQIKDDAEFAKQLQKNFETTRDNLQKEIGLYGLNSQAAIMGYETQLGEFKKLGDAHKQQLIDLAKIQDLNEINKELALSQREVDLSAMGDKGQLASVQLEYDLKHGIVVLNDQTQQQDKDKILANKKLAEQNARTFDLDEFLKQQQRSIDLYGVTSEAAKLQYDIEHGILKIAEGANDERLKRLNANAETIDSLQKFKTMTELTADASERVSESFSETWKNIDKGFLSLRDGIVDGFKTMLAEMAHQALTKPIILQLQQSLTGSAAQAGSTAAGSASGSAGGALAMGGVYAAVALAVVAGVSVWNKKQDERFAQMAAEYRQANQSMSKVLGEGLKKSQSINNAIESLKSTNSDVLGVNYEMLSALLDIRAGLGEVASGFAKTLIGGADYKSLGIAEGKQGISNSKLGLLIGGGLPQAGLTTSFSKLTVGTGGGSFDKAIGSFMDTITGKISNALYHVNSDVIDSGIKIFGGSLASIMEGGVLQAQNYADVKSTKKILGINAGTKVNRASEDLDDVFESQISSVFASAGDALKIASGAFGIEFDDYISQLSIKSQDLSLKGLEGDALTKEIESFFGSTLDNWAEVLLGGTTILNDFQQIGETAFDTMLRLSTETKTFNQYADLLSLNFKLIGKDAVYAVQSIAELSGGFDELSSSLKTYYDKFFDDSEKFLTLQSSIGDAFKELGYTLPKTREEFKNLIGGLNLATAADQERFAALVKLSGVTDQYLESLDKETKAKEDALRDAVGKSFDIFNKAIEKQRTGVQSQIDAASAALSSTKAVTDSLTASLKSMTLQTAQNELINRRAAQSQIITANAIAKAGGPLPIAGQLDDALSVLAQPSQDLYSSFEDYARDFYSTQKNIKELADATGSQQSIEQKNLDVLNSQLTALDDLVLYYQTQIDKLDNIDGSVISVSTAINNLTQTLLDAGITGVVAKPAVPVLSMAYETQQSVQSTAVAANNAENIGFSYGDLVSKVETLTGQLEASQYAIAKNTLNTAKLLTRWDIDGMPEVREVVS